MINEAKEIYFVGCGTTGVVSMCARYLFAKITKKKLTLNMDQILTPRRATRTKLFSNWNLSKWRNNRHLEAIEMAKSKNCKTACITNVKNSTISRAADETILINAGIEKAVASTKATTSQIGIIILLAHACIQKTMQAKQILHDASGKINDMLNPRYENVLLKLQPKSKTHLIYI